MTSVVDPCRWHGEGLSTPSLGLVDSLSSLLGCPTAAGLAVHFQTVRCYVQDGFSVFLRSIPAPGLDGSRAFVPLARDLARAEDAVDQHLTIMAEWNGRMPGAVSS